jgi:hypothetical protein
MPMAQALSSTEHTRPGRVIHLALTGAIVIYALIAEICENQLAPFEGFLPQAGVLDILRICFVFIGLAGLSVAFILLQRPHLVGSAGGAFVIAYASLDALATFGLVLFLMGGRRLDYYTFAAPAFVGQLLLWTQADRWDHLVELERQTLEAAGERYD